MTDKEIEEAYHEIQNWIQHMKDNRNKINRADDIIRYLEILLLDNKEKNKRTEELEEALMISYGNERNMVENEQVLIDKLKEDIECQVNVQMDLIPNTEEWIVANALESYMQEILQFIEKGNIKMITDKEKEEAKELLTNEIELFNNTLGTHEYRTLFPSTIKAIQILLQDNKEKDKQIEELETELQEEREEKVKMSSNIHQLIRKECKLINKLKLTANDENFDTEVMIEQGKLQEYARNILKFIEEGEN